MNTALVIEPCAPATYPFINGLHAATYCRVRHDSTLEEGFRTIEQTYCDLVLVTMDEHSPPAWTITDRIRSRAYELLIRCPYVILLFEKSLPIPDALKCRDRGAMCMRRDLPESVYEEAKLAFWSGATRKHGLTIRIEYRSGHHFFYIGSCRNHVELGAQLSKLAAILLAGNECYDIEYLASELEVCRQSVKKYFCELRRAFMVAQEEARMVNVEKEVFWMQRRRSDGQSTSPKVAKGDPKRSMEGFGESGAVSPLHRPVDRIVGVTTPTIGRRLSFCCLCSKTRFQTGFENPCPQ